MSEYSGGEVPEEKLTDGAKQALKEELKDFCKELFKYSMWVVALTYFVLSSRNSAQMHSAALFLRATFNLNDGAQGAPAPSANGFWPYMMASTQTIALDDYFTLEQPSSKYRKLRGTAILGSQLRQVRASGQTCTAFYDSIQKASLVQVPAPCYGSAGVLSSAAGAFTKEWQGSFM